MRNEEAIRYCDEYLARNIADIDKEFLKKAKEALQQQPCDNEYIKVPKNALKYRTAGIVAYNAEWLKNHFDIERAVICGEQQPCDDATLKDIFCMGCEYKEPCDKCAYSTSEGCQYDDITETIPPFEPCEDAISRQVAKKALEDRFMELQKRHDDKRYETNYCLNTILELPSVNPQKPICPSEKVDPAYKKTLNKWIGAEVLDRIRNEMHATAEKHEDGVYYLRDEWVDEIIDKYISESEGT